MKLSKQFNSNVANLPKSSSGVRTVLGFFCLNLDIASEEMKESLAKWKIKHITWYWLWPRSSSPRIRDFRICTSCNKEFALKCGFGPRFVFMPKYSMNILCFALRLILLVYLAPVIFVVQITAVTVLIWHIL